MAQVQKMDQYVDNKKETACYVLHCVHNYLANDS